MELCASSGGCKSIKFSLLTGFVEIIGTERFAAKSQLSLLNMKKFLNWVVQCKTGPSRKTVKVLEAKIRGRKRGNLFSIFSITDLPLLREANTEEVRHTIRASIAVYTCAAKDMRVQECIFRLFREKRLSPTLLKDSTFVQNILTKKKASTKTALPKSVPATTEAFFLLCRMMQVIECTGDDRLKAKMQRKTGCRIGVAVQIVARAGSAY